MNKYKVYGIGNALLDYEYKVNDTILSELSLDKGCMLLNDLEKQTGITIKLNKNSNWNFYPKIYFSNDASERISQILKWSDQTNEYDKEELNV